MLAFPAQASAPDKQALSTRPVFEANGAFGFCLSESALSDGRKLTIALSPTDEINLGLTIPGGGFTLGAHYDLAVTPDHGKERSVRAVAIDANSLLLQMGNSPPFTKALMDSKNLGVAGGGKSMVFALPAMSTTFDALKRCISDNKNKIDQRAAEAEKIMPETLKALLVAAGLKDIVPLRMDNLPPEQRPADFIWRTGKILGGVRERIAPKDKSLTELVGLHIQGLKNKCAGTFKAEINREETAPGLQLRTAEAECRMKKTEEGSGEKNVEVALLFYLTAANRFTVFTHESDSANKAEATAAREALRRTIVSLAQEMKEKKPPS